MKKVLTYLFLSIISFTLFSQNTFKMIFSGPGYDKGIAVFRTSEKGYLLVGNTASYGHGGSDVWVIALDSNADFQWQKTYGGYENEEAVKAIITPADELIITGNSTSSNPSTVNTFVLRLSKTGVPALMKTYGGEDWDFVNSLTLQNDSTILVCGKTFNGPHAGYYDPFIMAININGDSLWTSYAGQNDKEDNRDIVVGEDNKIYVVGSSLLPNHKADTSFVKCLDSLGNLQWQRYLTGYSRSQLLSVVLTNDSAITATGYHLDSSETYREPFLAKINRIGLWVWIRNGAQSSDAVFSYIEEEPSGKLVLGGFTTQFALGKQDMYNSTFDKDGWYFDANICGGLNDDFTTMIHYQPEDSSYLAIGTTKSYHAAMSGILLVQMNSTMNYDTTTRLILVSSLKNTDNLPVILDVFPNPASNYINLSFHKPLAENGIIRILDVNGKEIFNRKFISFSKEIKLNVSKLASGIYFINMESKAHNFTTKFIKK